GGELAALLGALHDGARGAVLDRAAGVHELGLAEDLAAGVLAHTPQAQERRVADRADEARDAAHATAPSAAASSAAAARAASVARVSAVPSAATAPVMSSAGALARCSLASRAISASEPRRIRCSGQVARSMIAAGCTAAAPAPRSRAMMAGSCATPM